MILERKVNDSFVSGVIGQIGLYPILHVRNMNNVTFCVDFQIYNVLVNISALVRSLAENSQYNIFGSMIICASDTHGLFMNDFLKNLLFVYSTLYM